MDSKGHKATRQERLNIYWGITIGELEAYENPVPFPGNFDSFQLERIRRYTQWRKIRNIQSCGK